MIAWRIGCSGYYYEEWKRNFYPEDVPKNKWFEFYCRHFNTVELNVTFYRFPRVESLKNWYNRSPHDFIFSVKAPRLITHLKRLKDAQKYLDNFYGAVREGLRDKAGAILFQFPADFKFETERLDRLVKLLDGSFNNVVEFRHSSWWQRPVFDALSRHNINFSGMSHPQLPETVVKTSQTIYYRFHGVPHLYISRYAPDKLEEVARNIQHAEGITEAYIYFNNTIEAAAVFNAREFQGICELVH